MSISATFAGNSKTIFSQRFFNFHTLYTVDDKRSLFYEINQKLPINAECLIKTGEIAKTLNEAMPINSN